MVTLILTARWVRCIGFVVIIDAIGIISGFYAGF